VAPEAVRRALGLHQVFEDALDSTSRDDGRGWV